MPVRYVPLDLLRFIAAMWVALYHCKASYEVTFLNKISGYGALGVDLFFVLSGFLIGDLWFMQSQRTKRTPGNRIWNFYLRRSFRIWPLYFFILFIYVLLDQPVKPLWQYLTFTQNFNQPQAFNQSWSICIEEHFYLLFPLIGVFLMKNPSFKKAFSIFLFVFIFGLLTRGSLWIYLRPDQVSITNPTLAFDLFYKFFYLPTWSRLDGLALGVLLAATKNYHLALWTKFLSYGNKLLYVGAILAVFSLAIGTKWIQMVTPSFLTATNSMPKLSFISLVMGFPLWALVFALVILAAMSPFSILRHFQNAWVSQLGMLSYSIYLTHDLTLKWVTKITTPLGSSPLTVTLISLVFVIFFSYLAYRIVEKPFLDLRDRLVK